MGALKFSRRGDGGQRLYSRAPSSGWKFGNRSEMASDFKSLQNDCENRTTDVLAHCCAM